MSSTDGDSVYGAAERPIRDGASWTDGDHERLLDGLREGLVDSELANMLGRTLGAVKSRARMMIDRDESRVSGEDGLDHLRRLVVGRPDYDWEPHVRASAAANGYRYWNDADLAALRQAWDTATPLPDLAASLGCSEPQIARQLLAMELADSTTAVVDRLGCSPDGVMELRYRLATDRATAEVWVLTITGLPGKRAIHVSLHSIRDDAEQTLEAVVEDLKAKKWTDTEATTIWWCISLRCPGNGSTGHLDSGEQTIDA